MKTLLSILFLSISIFAQDKYEYGKPEEMKGLKSVYINTQGNIKDRETIITELGKAGITLADDFESADMIVEFSSSTSTSVVNKTLVNPVDPTYNTQVPQRVKTKSGTAIVTIKGNKLPRVIFNFEGGRKDPAEKFAKEFAKTYRQVNGLEKK